MMRDMLYWTMIPAGLGASLTVLWITANDWWTGTRWQNSAFMTLAISMVCGLLGFLLWDYYITNVDPARTISNLSRLHAGRHRNSYWLGLRQGIVTAAPLVFMAGFVGGHLFWPKGTADWRTWFAWGNLNGVLFCALVLFPACYWLGHVCWGQQLHWDQDPPGYVEDSTR